MTAQITAEAAAGAAAGTLPPKTAGDITDETAGDTPEGSAEAAVRTRLVHLHIPKTAGTSLRERLGATHPELVLRHITGPAPDTLEPPAHIVTGHFSYDAAQRYGGEIVTVLRHPVDRFLSTYYFWRELYTGGVENSRKTRLAHALPLVDFTRALDEPELTSELYNRMCWQLHSSYRLPRRTEIRTERHLDHDALVSETLANLDRFAVVGFQDRYGDFLAALNTRFGLKIGNVRINVTARHSAVEDLTRAELAGILTWVEADMDMYTAARASFAAR